MQKTKRLSRRITLTFLLFGAALTLMFGFGLVIALKSIETNMLDDILYAELKEFQLQAESAQIPGFSHPRTTIIIYVTSRDETTKIPEHIRSLPQGIHDVTHDNQDYRVLVEHIGDTRYTVQFDDTSIHNRERDFIRLVWLCSIAALMLAFVIGWGLANYVISPIRRLAHQIKTFKNQPGESLDLSEFGDDEIGVLARQLQHYHEQLQHLLIREKEFASNVSHELRTPITNISLAAEVLATRADLSALEYARIQRIQRAVGEMSELIETFLILAQINNESVKYNDACEIGPVIRKVIEQQRVWLGNKPVEVVVEEKEPLKVSAPPGILSVLVANLIRNAFRYTEQGTITVSLESNQLTVRDTGRGIDMPTSDRIFKNDTKIKSGDTNRVGLGLKIVQRICERYGWTASFESTKGQGSRFTVLFTS
jgi:signal transduction histidine kinase